MPATVKGKKRTPSQEPPWTLLYSLPRLCSLALVTGLICWRGALCWEPWLIWGSYLVGSSWLLDTEYAVNSSSHRQLIITGYNVMTYTIIFIIPFIDEETVQVSNLPKVIYRVFSKPFTEYYWLWDSNIKSFISPILSFFFCHQRFTAEKGHQGDGAGSCSSTS